MLGKRLNVMGTTYKVRKCKTEADVDIYKRNSLAGQTDYPSRTISVHWDTNNKEDIEDTVLHELVHTVIYHLFRTDEELIQLAHSERFVDPFVSSLRDTLLRNKLVKFEIVK